MADPARDDQAPEQPEDRPDHESDEAELRERDAGAHAEKATEKVNFEPGDLSGGDEEQ